MVVPATGAFIGIEDYFALLGFNGNRDDLFLESAALDGCAIGSCLAERQAHFVLRLPGSAPNFSATFSAVMPMW